MKKGKKISLSLKKTTISNLTASKLQGGFTSYGGTCACGSGSAGCTPNLTGSHCKCL